MESGKAQLTQRRNFNKPALALAKLAQKNTSQEGLTLIECLVAIGVIAVVSVAFTPPIFLAVATQVQNRRAEQALQLAQGEVDRLRRTVEQGNYDDIQLPPRATDSFDLNEFKRQSAPNSAQRLQSNETYPSNFQTGRLIDVNGDGRDDFIVQTYRNRGVQRDGRTVAFNVGVRVYTAPQDFGRLENPPQRAASLHMTSGEGQQGRRPLALIYTSVIQSDNRNSLCSFRQFQGEGTNNAACQ